MNDIVKNFLEAQARFHGAPLNTRTIRLPANYNQVRDEFQTHFLRLKLEKMGVAYKRIDWK
jgi:hypothetical protein